MFMYICYVYVEYHNFFIVFLQPSKKKIQYWFGSSLRRLCPVIRQLYH